MVFVLIEILYFTYVRFFKFSILILSDPYQGYSTRQSVQTLDGLIPARVQQESKAHQASRAGRFDKTTENRQLHSLLHINVLWLLTRIKQTNCCAEDFWVTAQAFKPKSI